MDSDTKSPQGQETEIDEMKGKYLTFWTDGQLFAIPIVNVVQIIQMQEITPIPEFPMYAKGVINLRGTVIPVIDLRLRMGKMEMEYTAHTCIIVMSIHDQLAGLIVDRVNEVIPIDDEAIAPPPELGDSISSRFLQGVGKTEDSITLLLSVEKLVGEDLYSSL